VEGAYESGTGSDSSESEGTSDDTTDDDDSTRNPTGGKSNVSAKLNCQYQLRFLTI